MRKALNLQAIATLFVLLAGFVTYPARADSAPMSFSLYYGRGKEARDCWQGDGKSFDCSIIARGIIKADTAKRFRDFLTKLGLNESTGLSVTVLLDSEGGDVSSALEMGRLIRSYRMNTKLVRVEGRRQVCPRTSDYTLFRTKDHNFAPPNCYDVLYSEQPANCRSACTLVFMAGIHRSLASNSLYVFLNGRPDERLKWISDYGDIPDRQSQLGFHPVQPSANPDVPKEVRNEVLKFGAVWGQQESAKVLSYMEAMGIENEAFSFFTGDGAARIGPDGYYYPSVIRLQQVGILAGSTFGPFKLKLVTKGSAKPGLALVSSLPTWNADATQLSLFCQQSGDYANQMLAVISKPNQGLSQPELPPELEVGSIDLFWQPPTAAHGPTSYLPVVKLPRPFGTAPDRYGWRFTIDIDREKVVDLGWIEADSGEPAKKVGFPADSLARQSSDMSATHYIVALNVKIVTAMINSSILEFRFSSQDRKYIEPLVRAVVDSELRAQLALLPGNCVP